MTETTRTAPAGYTTVGEELARVAKEYADRMRIAQESLDAELSGRTQRRSSASRR